MAARLHLPFEILSDEHFRLTDALQLPTFVADGMRLIERLTLIARDGRIETVFHPIANPETNAGDTLQWLLAHPLQSAPLILGTAQSSWTSGEAG